MDDSDTSNLREALENDLPDLLLEIASKTREVNGAPLLAVAAKHNAYRCCQELLKQSWVDPNRGKNKTTPLCAAAAAGAAEAVSVLLADGRANPRLARMDGVTPLLIATQQRHLGIMRMLLEDRRTQSNARALYPLRITPLLLTLRASDPSTMHLLLNLGQDLDLEANSFQRQTPLQICRELGCPPSMQRMLLDFAATDAGGVECVPATTSGSRFERISGCHWRLDSFR